MDFDQLETFLEVARHTSFSRAAEKRFRTQPAISSQIRALEEEIGARLFDRSGGKVALTGAGKVFQQYAEHTLEARKTMLTTVAEMERVPRGMKAPACTSCRRFLPSSKSFIQMSASRSVGWNAQKFWNRSLRIPWISA
jgi:DNA-binding transcriptional LysR family regulator